MQMHGTKASKLQLMGMLWLRTITASEWRLISASCFSLDFLVWCWTLVGTHLTCRMMRKTSCYLNLKIIFKFRTCSFVSVGSKIMFHETKAANSLKREKRNLANNRLECLTVALKWHAGWVKNCCRLVTSKSSKCSSFILIFQVTSLSIHKQNFTCHTVGTTRCFFLKYSKFSLLTLLHDCRLTGLFD